jgi:cob(I)alamin adenosyltransferase
MKIYTKTGDDGTTSLATGERVSKVHPQVEAYGALDELSAHLGMLRAMRTDTDAVIKHLQELLMQCSAILAGSRSAIYLITENDIEYIEKQIDILQQRLPVLRNFVIPSGCMAACQCHIARCVCRRAERRAAALENDSEPIKNVLRLLNRMSDYLFVLSRSLNIENGKEEIWQK